MPSPCESPCCGQTLSRPSKLPGQEDHPGSKAASTTKNLRYRSRPAAACSCDLRIKKCPKRHCPSRRCMEQLLNRCIVKSAAESILPRRMKSSPRARDLSCRLQYTLKPSRRIIISGFRLCKLEAYPVGPSRLILIVRPKLCSDWI